MAEHWDTFFKLARPKEVETDGVTLATTTDSRAALNDAAADRQRREREATYTYTEVGRGVTEQDGGTEHSEPIIRTDGPKPDDPCERLDNMVLPLTPEGIAAARQQYQVQLLAAKAAIPDFDEVVDQDTKIPNEALYMVQMSGLPNAPLVAYYLGKHRTECERLCNMTSKQRQQRIVEISAALVTRPEGIALDTADYRTYRRVRNQQIKSRV